MTDRVLRLVPGVRVAPLCLRGGGRDPDQLEGPGLEGGRLGEDLERGTLIGPGGTTRLRVSVASSAKSVGKLWTGNPSGVRWLRSCAIAPAERPGGPTGSVRAGGAPSR